VAWLRARTYRGFCLGLPGLLEAMMRLCSRLSRLLLRIAKAFVLDACRGLCVLDACRGLCVLEVCRDLCSRRASLWCSSHVESTRGMTRLLSFSPLELFSGVPPIVET
jgi:hypothetical protein